MGFTAWLKKLLKRDDNFPPHLSDTGKFYYLLNYNEEYEEILRNLPDRTAALSELFIFRFWLTQYSYRLQKAQGVSEDLLLSEIIFDGVTLGKGIFELQHKIDIERALGSEFPELMEDRFKEYDQGVIDEKNSEDQLGLVCASIILANRLTQDAPVEFDHYLIEKTNRQFTEIVALHVGDIESAKRIVREITFTP